MFWRRYVPLAERQAKAQRKVEKLRKKGANIQPVEIEGRTIARSFWGKGWCAHLESFSDYSNRLPRGRAYVRNGSVCHLEVKPGRVEAMVAGSSLYTVSIEVRKLNPALWKTIKSKCAGQVGSMLELLQGKLSDQVMSVVTDRDSGMFPKPGEISLSCSCPDWAVMCKHVASVLYGVGSRLDTEPELLFLLRDVDPSELIGADVALPGTTAGATDEVLADSQLGGIFGIDVDTGPEARTSQESDGSPEEASSVRLTAKRKPKRNRRKPPGTEAKRTKPTKEKAGAKPREKKSAKAEQASSAAARKARKSGPAEFRPTGRSVALLREKLGLTVAQFAATLGVTPASVYRWESVKGSLKLHARTLTALKELHRERQGRQSD